MPLPPSAPVELLPDPDRATAALRARSQDPRLADALAALLGDVGPHPFDEFVVSATGRLAGPGADLAGAVLEMGGAPADSGSTPFVSRVVSAGQRLQRLTARLTEYADACGVVVTEGGGRADVDLDEATDAALGELADRGQPAPRRVSVSGPPLPVDPVLVRLALRHLLGNAALYAADPAGGSTGATPVSVTGSLDDQGWQLVVADAGPGIPTADRMRVLQPLVRLDRDRATPGDGLGLAICARVARAHGGMIAVNRAENGGAALRLTGSLR